MPQKIGIRNEREWSACVWPDAVLIKRAACAPEARYPDYGVNCEVYMEGDYMELETLGPLECLRPGEATAHRETWRVCEARVPHVDDEAALHEALSALAGFDGGVRVSR
jgi:hypothetical protein